MSNDEEDDENERKKKKESFPPFFDPNRPLEKGRKML